jgi:hypothetical protein
MHRIIQIHHKSIKSSHIEVIWVVTTTSRNEEVVYEVVYLVWSLKEEEEEDINNYSVKLTTIQTNCLSN